MMKLTIDGYPNLIQNKYLGWYRNIIINRINNPPSTDNYTENHHILPKCLGGDNSQKNIITLTAREHFIVHALLTKFINKNSKDYYSILCAFSYMNIKSKNTIQRYSNSLLYSNLKEELSTERRNFLKNLFEENKEFKEKHQKGVAMSWKNGLRDSQLKWMKNNSPFKIKAIHRKTMESRDKNKTNIFVTNNPMKDKKKALQIAGKRKGQNHYIRKNNKYYFKIHNDWKELLIKSSLKESIKDQIGCSYSTFFNCIDGKEVKRGKYKGLKVKRIKSENKKN